MGHLLHLETWRSWAVGWRAVRLSLDPSPSGPFLEEWEQMTCLPYPYPKDNWTLSCQESGACSHRESQEMVMPAHPLTPKAPTSLGDGYLRTVPNIGKTREAPGTVSSSPLGIWNPGFYSDTVPSVISPSLPDELGCREDGMQRATPQGVKFW